MKSKHCCGEKSQSSSKVNVGVNKQSKVADKLTKTLGVGNYDVELICDTGADVLIRTETTSDMLGLESRKPDCPQTSAEGSDFM